MTTSTNNTESKTESIVNSGYAEAEKTKEVEVDKDSKLDDFGYTAPETKEEEVEKKPEVKVEEEKEVEKKATGYDKEPELKKEETKEELDVKSILGKLPEGYDKELTSKFAVENKLSKEQMEAYVNFAKEESERLIADKEAQVLATRKQWLEELKSDNSFGGELFVKNVDRVEKLLDKHMPNMKKVLTDRGTMLPPYIMKDLLGVSKLLNPTTNLVNGEPSNEKEPETNFLVDLYK